MAKTGITLDIPLQPKQLQLYELMEGSHATWLGYGGSRGGGKSSCGRRLMLIRRLKHPKTSCCILRRTYDLVRENHIDKYMLEYPSLRQWYHIGDKEIRLPNGSVIAFRYAETKNDVKAMIGKEYMDFMVDQAEQFGETELNTMKSCARWPGVSEWQCKFLLTFNPGDVGMAFLKRIFYDKKYTVNERAEEYAFIQAYGWDNAEWSRASLEADGLTVKDYYGWDSDARFKYYISRTQFGREQNALPPALRLGWLLGHMDQFAGQYFDIFSWERHMSRLPVLVWHERCIGIDWGFKHESGVHWGAQVMPEMFHIYREFVGAGRSAKALAQEIVDRTPVEERPQVRSIGLSHDAFAQRDERDPINVQMDEVFQQNGFPSCSRAGGDPEASGVLLYDMMNKNQISISPSCPRLIETIPMVMSDDTNPRKTIKFDLDDPYDSCRHLLSARAGFTDVPEDVQIRAHAEQIGDPVAKWFYLQKHMNRETSSVIEVDPRPAWMRNPQ